MNPRAVQELDLRLQEGRADDPVLIEGLVRLYADELFRFAWVIYTHETESPTIQRLLARRTVAESIAAALHQIRRFQEQPGTFLWLLRVVYQHAKRQQPLENSHSLLAQHLHTSLNLSTENIAYVFKISERRAAAFLETEYESPSPYPVFLSAPPPLTLDEITALIEQIRSEPILPSHPGIVSRFASEFSLVVLVLIVFIFFIRSVPRNVVFLPTPVPSLTPTLPPKPDWEMTPVPLPTTTNPFSAEVYFEPENPYLVWRQTQILQVEETFISTIAFSPSEPLLAVGNNQNQVTLWDMRTFTLLETLRGHEGGIHSLAFSPDGSLLATGGGDGIVHLWEMPYGYLVQVFLGHPNVIHDLAFSPDGERLAVAAGKELWFWQVSGGTKIASYSQFDANVLSVRYSPDGQYLGVTETDGTAWILRARDAYPLFSFKTSGNSLLQNPLIFTPDSQYLFAISSLKRPVVIRLEGNPQNLEGEIIKNIFPIENNMHFPSIIALALSPDGRFAAGLVNDGGVYLWDTATWTPLQAPFRTYDYSYVNRELGISFDNQMIVVSRQTGELIIMQFEDLSAQIKALEFPRYYKRLESDRHRWTYTFEENGQVFPEQFSFSDLESLNETVGFNIKIPLIGLLDGDNEFGEFQYDPASGLILAYVNSEQQPGLFWGFTFLQQKIEPGQGINFGLPPFFGLEIGISAIVEPIQIGSMYGELVFGGWEYLPEDNEDLFNWSPQPGDQISYITRWNGDPTQLSISLMEDDVLYRINGPVGAISNVQKVAQNAMQLLAQSLYDPHQVPIPWNLKPYIYTVQRGDTCANLAERFYTTQNIIQNLNHLEVNCRLVPGQTVILPPPAEPYITTDLNCDGQEETLLLMHDVNDLESIQGIAMDVETDNIRQRIGEFNALDMGVESLQLPEIFSMGECDQLIRLSGGKPTASQTRVFQWNGKFLEILLFGPGLPYSSNNDIASMVQTQDKFVITLIEYDPTVHPVAGPCSNEVTDYTWNGDQFEAGEMKTILGECVGFP